MTGVTLQKITSGKCPQWAQRALGPGMKSKSQRRKDAKTQRGSSDLNGHGQTRINLYDGEECQIRDFSFVIPVDGENAFSRNTFL